MYQHDPRFGPPERRGAVRLTGDSRVVTLTSLDGGRRTLFTVEASFDPGVEVPGVVAQRIADLKFPQVVAEMEATASAAQARDALGRFVPSSWDAVRVTGPLQALPPVRRPLLPPLAGM